MATLFSNGWPFFFEWMAILFQMDGHSFFRWMDGHSFSSGWPLFFEWMAILFRMDGHSFFKWMAILFQMDGNFFPHGWMAICFSNRWSLWVDTKSFCQRLWRFGFFLCAEHTDYGSWDPRETLPRHSTDLSAEQGHRRQGPAPRWRRSRAGDSVSRPSDAVRPHGAPCLPALWHEW